MGLLAQYLFVRERAGLNMPVAAIAFLVAGWLVRDGANSTRAWRLAAASSSLAFAALCAIRTEAAVVFFDAAAAFLFVGAFVLACAGTSLAAPVIALVDDAMAMVGAAFVRPFGVWVAALPAARGSLVRASPVAGYAAGGLIAVPFLVVFGALFAAADAVFERSLRDLLELAWLRDLMRDAPARTTIAFLAAWVTTGAFAQITWRASRGPARARVPGVLPSDAAFAALALIDALFVGFVALQIAYLFGGRDTIDAAGVTYSAYGRRGFFELVVVSAIVAVLLFACDILLRSRGRAYAAAALTLLVLTAAVVVSAGYRMALYQQAYGWSELRLYTFAGIGFIACALVILGWAVLARRMERALPALVAAAAAAALAVNAIAPADFVARRNIERVLHPASLPEDASRGLDVGYLVTLGEGAIPALFELAPELPSPERSAVLEVLRAATLRSETTVGWQSWNLDRERARSIVVRASGPGIFMR